MSLPAGVRLLNANVELPVSGQPSLYPFDHFRQEDSAVPITLSLQSRLQRIQMPPPTAIDPASVRTDTDPYNFLYVRSLEFKRPLYLMVLAVLLVTLIAAAAIYAVRAQPVQQLLAGVGGLVLGVWGIRSILVPGGPPYVTAVDLALSLVILIMLAGIIVRGLLQLRRDVIAERSTAGADHAE